jgi:hypothetical protein
MKNHSVIALAILVPLLTAGIVTGGLTQPAKKTAPRAPAATAQRPAAPATPKNQGFVPGFDDLMTMLVQPRHIRLYYAGMAKNWEMAAAENRDLRASFDRLTQAIPEYLGNDVNSSVATFIKPKMDAMDAAIAAADANKFSSAYQEMTTACNACHTYMEHPFLVITVPQGAVDTAHSDQDFKAAP